MATPVLPAPARDRIARAYDEHYTVMRNIAIGRFRIAACDVRPLIHDVFLAFMRHHESIADDRAWLIRATSNACLNYLRDKKVSTPLPEMMGSEALSEAAIARLDVARLLRRISPRCRTVLWLRYVDGLTAEQIAQRCASTTSSGHYGRTLVHRCLRHAREHIAASIKDRE